ncbi:hypothetical protein [Cryobacterium lyxosi]|uniref:Uncharacterized protein n=1 Tax=Cryobacterium lyxosi TaxID=1259228 RepID=A0A4R8ZDU0_9MICO|nr:hypothetical protein [Cryobacterium lyxosi]TFD25105.1 hypothetical protein E3T27_10000 [Cryobacterium lyxosi]
MFTIEDAPVRGALGDRLYVVDHERGVWLQRVSGVGRRPGDAFQLVREESVIPFNMSEEEETDPNSGQRYVLRRFEIFGISGIAKRYAGIEPFAFSDDIEKHEFMKLAIEAVLVYGFHYTTTPRPEGDVRIDADGQIFTLGGFGYATEG